jgi:hypothetical protein
VSSDRDEIHAGGGPSGEDRSDAGPDQTGEFTIDYTPPAWYTQHPSTAPAADEASGGSGALHSGATMRISSAALRREAAEDAAGKDGADGAEDSAEGATAFDGSGGESTTAPAERAADTVGSCVEGDELADQRSAGDGLAGAAPGAAGTAPGAADAPGRSSDTGPVGDAPGAAGTSGSGPQDAAPAGWPQPPGPPRIALPPLPPAFRPAEPPQSPAVPNPSEGRDDDSGSRAAAQAAGAAGGASIPSQAGADPQQPQNGAPAAPVVPPSPAAGSGDPVGQAYPTRVPQQRPGTPPTPPALPPIEAGRPRPGQPLPPPAPPARPTAEEPGATAQPDRPGGQHPALPPQPPGAARRLRLPASRYPLVALGGLPATAWSGVPGHVRPSRRPGESTARISAARLRPRGTARRFGGGAAGRTAPRPLRPPR